MKEYISDTPEILFSTPNQDESYIGNSRLSYRSKNSSTSISKNKLRTLKNCLRRSVEFMFTQVGVGAVVIAYTILGAAAFQSLESSSSQNDPLTTLVNEKRGLLVAQLWDLTTALNTLHPKIWSAEVNKALLTHQETLVFAIRGGYESNSNSSYREKWNFSSALLYSLSVITMIGYGNLCPKTSEGKIATMLYAVIGIPVYILYLLNMGQVFASVLKWAYRRVYLRMSRSEQTVKMKVLNSENENLSCEQSEQVIVPSGTCLWVMSFYLLLGTIMFAEWESWNYLDSLYFCVTSLSKIGFGDFVPGNAVLSGGEPFETVKEAQIKLIINFVYLLFGMGLLAMCYILLKEEVRVKTKRWSRHLMDKIQRIKYYYCGPQN